MTGELKIMLPNLLRVCFLVKHNVSLYFLNSVNVVGPISAVHYVIWRDLFVQIELGVKIANLGGE